jgi:hypothetical protein
MKNFKQKVMPPKVYSKEFSSTFIQKGLQKFIKPLVKWILVPTTILLSVAIISYHGIFVPRMTTKLATT